MTDIESLKEILALHGYNYKEECNIWEQGVTYYFSKTVGNKNLFLSCHTEQQFGPKFWVFSLKIYIPVFKEKPKYLSPNFLSEVWDITEDYLKYLPKFEEKLLKIDNNPIIDE